MPSPEPSSSLSTAQPSSSNDVDATPALTRAIALFFNAIKSAVHIGFFKPPSGGEPLYYRPTFPTFFILVPKRIKTLYDNFLKGRSVTLDRSGLSLAITAFNQGSETGSLASRLGIRGARAPIMTHLANTMTQIDEALDKDSSDAADSEIISSIHDWVGSLFSNLLTEENNKASITSFSMAQNHESLTKLQNIYLFSLPISLTFSNLTNIQKLFDTIALAMALKFNIESITLVDCDISAYDTHQFIAYLKPYSLLKAFTSENSISNYVDLIYALNSNKPSVALRFFHLNRVYVMPEFTNNNYNIIDLSGNQLGISYVEHRRHISYPNCVMDMARQPGSKIAVVNFACNDIRPDHTLDIILQALSPQCSVTSLNLRGNHLTLDRQLWIQFALKLKHAWHTHRLSTQSDKQAEPHLTWLNLANMPLSDTFILSKLLETTTLGPGQVHGLNLSNCDIDATLIQTLITTLTNTAPPTSASASALPSSSQQLVSAHHAPKQSSLRHLMLAKNPVSDQGARDLIKATIGGQLPITELDLSECNLSDTFGLLILSDLHAALLQQRTVIAEIDGEAIYEITKFSLKTLDLSNNFIDPRTLRQIYALIAGEPMATKISPAASSSFFGDSGLSPATPTAGVQTSQQVPEA